LLASGVILLVIRSAIGAPPQVTLTNNTLPGHQTVHEITRKVTRLVKRAKFIETLAYAQSTTLVQCNIALPQAGKILVYQMTVDDPAKVKTVLNDKKRVDPTPAPEQFNLSKGSTRLTSEHKSAREMPLTLPPGDAAQNVILASVLDFAYWQPKKIEAGHKWQRRIETEFFEGTQTLQFVDMTEIGGQAAARLALKVEGQFKGSLERSYAFGMAEAIIHWARLERTIAKVEGVAKYQRRRQGVTEDYELKVEENLRNVTQLSEPQQERVKEQMTAFAGAMQAQSEGRVKDARAECQGFRKAWPDSVFTPAILELGQRVAPDAPSQDRMSRSQLREVIKRSIVAYEAARSNRDGDLLDLTLKTMGEITRDYGAILAKLCRDKDETTRAHAAFALAFSRRPEDLIVAQKCAVEKSSKVRVMALTGLAAAANPGVNAELLLGLLDDPEVGVRRRALQAIGACVARENFAVAKLVEKIDRLMVYDKNDGVRSDAVAALAAIGAAADAPRLEEALKHELNTEIREQIHRGIEELRKR
jgi:hypothetical protein